MSQDDFVYVLYLCDSSVYKQSKQKQTVSADTSVHTRQQRPTNDCKTTRIFMSHFRGGMLHYIVCTFVRVRRHLFSVRSSSPPPLTDSFNSLSARTCHCHPAQPGGRRHPAFSHPASCRFAQVIRGLTPKHRPAQVCILPVFCFLQIC